jgi:hypothetical protein
LTSFRQSFAGSFIFVWFCIIQRCASHNASHQPR